MHINKRVWVHTFRCTEVLLDSVKFRLWIELMELGVHTCHCYNCEAKSNILMLETYHHVLICRLKSAQVWSVLHHLLHMRPQKSTLSFLQTMNCTVIIVCEDKAQYQWSTALTGHPELFHIVNPLPCDVAHICSFFVSIEKRSILSKVTSIQLPVVGNYWMVPIDGDTCHHNHSISLGGITAWPCCKGGTWIR